MSANQVRFYVYKSMSTLMAKRDLDRLAQLAWKAALAQEIHPTRILIRSEAHNTTMGKPDPNGWHYTVCFKNRATEAQAAHIAYHAYVKDKTSFDLVQGTFSQAKADATKKKNGEAVWDDAKIEEVKNIVYVSPSQPSSRSNSPAPTATRAPARPSSRAGSPAPTGSKTTSRPSTPSGTGSRPGSSSGRK